MTVYTQYSITYNALWEDHMIFSCLDTQSPCNSQQCLHYHCTVDNDEISDLALSKISCLSISSKLIIHLQQSGKSYKNDQLYSSKYYVPGVSKKKKKKYGVAVYQYFKYGK